MREYQFCQLASENQVSRLQEFLDSGIDINWHDSWSLRYAVIRGADDSVIWLLQHGANPNVMNGFCMMIAVERADAAMLLLMLENRGMLKKADVYYYNWILKNRLKQGQITQKQYEDTKEVIEFYNQIINN